jgi:hypothetical protein
MFSMKNACATTFGRKENSVISKAFQITATVENYATPEHHERFLDSFSMSSGSLSPTPCESGWDFDDPLINVRFVEPLMPESIANQFTKKYIPPDAPPHAPCRNVTETFHHEKHTRMASKLPSRKSDRTSGRELIHFDEHDKKVSSKSRQKPRAKKSGTCIKKKVTRRKNQWTSDEEAILLREGTKPFKDWELIAKLIPRRTKVACINKLKKLEEDGTVALYIQQISKAKADEVAAEVDAKEQEIQQAAQISNANTEMLAPESNVTEGETQEAEQIAAV